MSRPTLRYGLSVTLLGLSLFLALGCGGSQDLFATPTPTAMPTLTPTPTYRPTPPSTNTPTVTPPPTPTSTSAPPMAGEWAAPTDFGKLAFTVSPDRAGIAEVRFEASGLDCGRSRLDGGISFTGPEPWPITNGQFAISVSGAPFDFSIRGSFDETGTYASGTWELDSCSGAWESHAPTMTMPAMTPTPTLMPAVMPTPAAAPLLRRPDNGEFIKLATSLSGEGELEVNNGTELDAVAVLTTLADETLVAVYVRAGSEFTVVGIPDGEYKLFFVLGEGWDDAARQFTRKVERRVFEDLFSYTTTATTATIWSVTLHPVPGGTASTEHVDPSEFPSLE